MGRDGLPSLFIRDLSRLRDGDSAGAGSLISLLSWAGLELHLRAIVGSAKVCWVVDISHNRYSEEGFLSTLDSELRCVNAIQASLNDWLKGGRRTLMYSFGRLCWDADTEDFSEEPSEASTPSYAVVVSAVVLLSLVYQYLTGNVDRGGSKAYSRSSLAFRDIYVATVLFLGAYVWIKFREEVAFKGVHPRKVVVKQGGIKIVYEARLTPPMWNGQKVPRLDLGQFATPQEAHNKFLIAAFYYGRDAGLLDDWFQVPPMSDEAPSLTGLELRARVIAQAKKVYEDFKKAEATLLLQELYEACEVQVTQDQDEVSVDPCGTSLLHSVEHQNPVIVSQAENSGLGLAMLDNHGLECASHSFDGMHVGLALPNGHNLGSQVGCALPVSQLPLNTESGMSLSGSDQLDSLETRVDTQQQHISLQQQISAQQREMQELRAQISQLQHQQRIQQQQQLQESRIPNPHWPCQFCLQQQQPQDVNGGFPSFEVEMEESIYQLNYSGLMAAPLNGGEAQEAFV